MLRNIPFTGHLLVLGLLFLLRLPSLFDGYFLSSESLYLVCAEKIAAGASLYDDVWFEGPPVIIWLYSFFQFVFGDSALTIIRLVTILYLYITITYFQGMLVEYKVFKKNQIAPACLLALLCSMPWYQLEMTPSLLFLWPTLYSFHVIILLTLTNRRNFRRLFIAGLLMMLCLMMDYSAISILIGLGVAYFAIRQPKIQEFFTLLLGSGVSLVFIGLILYFSGSVLEYWELGVRHYVSQLLVTSAPPFAKSFESLLLVAALNWGVIVVLAVMGFSHFRIRIYSYVIVIRRVEQTMFLWTLSGLLILFLSGSKLRFHDFLVFAPPLAFYAGKAWYFQLPRFLTFLRTVFLLAVPIYMGLIWIGLTLPPTLSEIEPRKMANHLDITCHLPAEYPGLKTYFDQHGKDKSLWILADKPELYLYLNMPCKPRYSDFRIVYHKFSYISGQAVRRPEPDAEIYRNLGKDLPDFILEPPSKGFSNLKRRFPSLLSNYKLEDTKGIDGFRIWKLHESP